MAAPFVFPDAPGLAPVACGGFSWIDHFNAPRADNRPELDR
jgi:hypothetical protein